MQCSNIPSGAMSRNGKKYSTLPQHRLRLGRHYVTHYSREGSEMARKVGQLMEWG